MSPSIESLPIVILYPHSRCNCRCLMCDIWKQTENQSVSVHVFERCLDDFERLRVKWVVLSGGEPLMHPDLFRLCVRLRERAIRTTILSTGILFERYAAQITDTVDDAIVSLDGPPEVHDRVRRVPGAFTLLARGIEAIHRLRPGFRVSARSTVQLENYRYLRETARTAQSIGLAGISFLAVDLTSSAFNRPQTWPRERQNEIALTESDLPFLEAEIEALLDERRDDPFLQDTPGKLRRIALHYRAHLGLCEPVAPRCNAPWVSAVVESDGTVRPCFFHEPIGRIGPQDGISIALNNPSAQKFRASLDVSTNPICRRCVCSLSWKE